MQKLDFNQAVEQIVKSDPRYAAAGYHLIREALDFTIKMRKKAKEPWKHVSGQQLLEGIRVYALKEYGPMVPLVLEYWGIARCEDFGQMVFNLIRVGAFGKTEQDSVEDFSGGYAFWDAFVLPYLPDPVAPVAASGKGGGGGTGEGSAGAAGTGGSSSVEPASQQGL
jgi:uncharacterized repeat protein (TIGR04138 family)